MIRRSSHAFMVLGTVLLGAVLTYGASQEKMSKNLNSSDAQVQALAKAELSRLALTGDPAYLPVMYKVISQADETVRPAAVEALVSLAQAMADRGGNWQIVRAVYLDILKQGQGAQRDAALTGLGTLGDASCVGPVLEVIKDADAQTRLLGIDALRRMRGAGPPRVLVEQYPHLDEALQLALVPVLVEHKHPRILPALEQVEHADVPGLRQAILRVLSEGETPRVQAAPRTESGRDDQAIVAWATPPTAFLMFDRQKISSNAFEAASAFDVDNNGVVDIISGEYWYEGPDFDKAHKICELPEIHEYHDDFSNYPMDVNGNGYMDIMTGGWFGKTVRWRENPQGRHESWTTHDVDECGNIEITRFWDVNGDGHVEAIPNAGGNIVVYQLIRDAAGKGTGQFKKHVLKQGGIGHGLGFGDINGDGRGDFVAAGGWLEAPEKPFEQEWIWHQEFELGSASVPIIVHDVNEDGLADLIVGSAHGYGLVWYEQKLAGSKREWIKHVIDMDHSQYHDMFMADLDRNGKLELITGKRYRAHNGNDPGSTDPLFLCYFKINGGKFDRYTLEYGPAGQSSGAGIYFWVADVDGNGWLDIVAPGKEGLYLFRNRGFVPKLD